MKRINWIVSPFLIAVLLLTGCTSPANDARQAGAGSPRPAKTLPVLAYVPNPSETPTLTPDPALAPPPTATATPTPTAAAPTETPLPAAQEQPTLARTPRGVVTLPPIGKYLISSDSMVGPQNYYTTCNLAELVSEPLVPYGTAIYPGRAFVKTWRLRNIGYCIWDDQYDFIYINGDRMGGPLAVDITKPVLPGETVDIDVAFTAPTTQGFYEASWKLRSSGGDIFGTGQNGDVGFLIGIVSTTSITPPFAVDSVNITVNYANYSGACPVDIIFRAAIHANGPGTVTYYWARSDGSTSDTGTLVFNAAGTRTVTDTWTLGSPGSTLSVWNSIYIIQPNNQAFPPFTVNLDCS